MICISRSNVHNGFGYIGFRIEKEKGHLAFSGDLKVFENNSTSITSLYN
jgi:hypothetical protein